MTGLEFIALTASTGVDTNKIVLVDKEEFLLEGTTYKTSEGKYSSALSLIAHLKETESTLFLYSIIVNETDYSITLNGIFL